MREFKRRSVILAAAVASVGLARVSVGATATWVGQGGDNNWKTLGNWTNGGVYVPVAGDTLTFDGASRLTNTNNFAAGTLFGAITFAATAAGPFTLNGNQVGLNGNINDNTLSFTNAIALPLALQVTPTIDVVANGSLAISGVISGAGFGLTKTDGGQLTLSGANTFTGPLTVSGGTLNIASDANLGQAPATATAGQLVLGGGATLVTTATMTINANRGIALGPGTATLDVASGTTDTYNGIITNNGGAGSLTKLSFGNLTLGGANTYSGATNVMNGQLLLDFTQATAPQNNIINPASTLSLGGATAGLGQNNNATLAITGKAATANVQSFAGTNINIYGSVISATNGATAGSVTLNLGALTHTVGGTVNIPSNGTPATGTGSVTNMGTVTTTTSVATTHGILGGWAVTGAPSVQRGITIGTDWATVDGTGKIVPYTGYVAAPVYDGTAANTFKGNAAIQANADKNLKFVGTAGSQEMRVDADNANSTTDINTFAFTLAGANNTLTIGAGNTLRLGVNGGIFKENTGNNQIYVGGAGGVVSGNGSGPNIGTLTAGGPNDNTPGEIVITLDETANNNGTLNILSHIADNGTGAVTVVKTGVSSIKIDGHNTYSGGTFINQGRFQMAGGEAGDPNPDALGSGTVTVAPGAYLFISAINNGASAPTQLFSGPGAIPNALLSTAQNAPVLNNMVLSGIGTNQEGIGCIRLGNRAIMSGNITLGGAARIGGGNAAAYPGINLDGTSVYVDPGDLFSGKITGPFSFDVGAAASVITNFVISNHANDWTGNTNIIDNGGNGTTLRLGNNDVIPDGLGKGNLVFGNTGTATAVVDMNGFSETVNGLSTTATAVGSAAIIQNNGFTATVIPDPVNAGNKIYSITAGTSVLTVGNNDQTATFAGIIRDSDPSAAVTLPDPNSTPGTTATATVGFTAPWANPTTGSAAKIALTKIGSGVQVLSGTNTYSGNTNVNAGTLAVTGSLLSTGNVLVNTSASSAGTLAGTGSVGNVTLAASTGSMKAAISPGTGVTGTVGTLTAASLTVNNGDLQFDLNNPGNGSLNDQLHVTGTTTFNAAATISPSGGGLAGTYTVVQGDGGITYGVTPTLNTPVGTRSTFSLQTLANQINVVVVGGPANLVWRGTTPPGDGTTWDVTSTKNWFNPAPAVNGADFFYNGDSVTFDDTAGPANNVITLGTTVSPGLAAGATSAITFNNSTINYTINGPGSIAGTGAVVKNGTGGVTINSSNTFSGGTTINAGTVTAGGANALGTGGVTLNSGAQLNINQSAALGSGALTINGGTLDNTSGAAVTVSPAVPQNWNADFTFAGSNSLNLGTGAVTLNASPTITVNGTGTLTVGGVISGGGNITKAGPGTMTLTGVNTYSGTTSVTAGTLTVSGGLATSTITVSPAATFTLSGTLSSVPNVTDDGTATITAARTINSINGGGTLNLGNTLTLNNGGTFTGVVANNGANTGSITLAGGSLTLSGNNSYTGNTTINTGTTLNVNGPSALGTSKLTVNLSSAIDNTSGIPVALTTNNAQVWVGDFTFNGSNNLNLGTGAVALNGDTNLSVNGSTLTVGGAIANGTAGTTLTKSGVGTLVLGGVSTYTGNTTVNGGTLTLNASGALASPNVTVSNGATGNFNGALAATATVNANGTTNFGGSTGAAVLNRPLAALNVASGVTVTITPSAFPFTPAVLQPATHNLADSTAKLNLTNNEVILNEDLTTAVGRVTSSQVFTTSTGGGIGSLALSPTQTELRFTLLGDTNLDGGVDVTDLGNLASSYGATSGAKWVQGDTNYDGAVDVTDLGNLASNYGGHLASGPSAGPSAMLASSLATVASSGGSAVPEPASLGLLAVGSLGLLGRRRRKA